MMTPEHHAEITRLVKQYGRTITPEELVEEARKPESPLHDAWDWDVDQAAHSYWIHRARQVLREYRVVVRLHDKGTARPTTLVIHGRERSIKGVVHDPSVPPGQSRYRDSTSIKPKSWEAFKSVLDGLAACRTTMDNQLLLAEYWGLDADRLVKSIEYLDDFLAYLRASLDEEENAQCPAT